MKIAATWLLRNDQWQNQNPSKYQPTEEHLGITFY
jgi:hypothetical protein